MQIGNDNNADPSIMSRRPSTPSPSSSSSGQYHYFQHQQLAQQAFERQVQGAAQMTEPIGIPARNGGSSSELASAASSATTTGHSSYIKLPQIQTNQLRYPFSASATTSSYFSPTSASRLAPHTNEPSSVASSYKSAAPPYYEDPQQQQQQHSFESSGAAFPPSSFPSDHSHSMPIQPRTSLLTTKLSAQSHEGHHEPMAVDDAPAAGFQFPNAPPTHQLHKAMTLPDPLAARRSSVTYAGSYSSDPRHFSTSQPSSLQSHRFMPRPASATTNLTLAEPAAPTASGEAATNITNANPANSTTTTTTSGGSNAPSSGGVGGEHLDIANHPVADVIVMLTALLQKIVQTNDAIQPQQYPLPSDDGNEEAFTANVLAFHGRNVPAISLHAYLSRILKYCPTTNEVFISLLVYFDRIAQRAAAAAAHGEGSAGTPATNYPLFVIDSYNIHRLIIAGVTVASKFFSDVFYKNSRYAKVGGLPVDELNHLELQFLLLTDFRLMISVEELQRYGDLLLRFWQKEQG
ncbi:hypothetical protein TRVA0_004S00936 [Trichomonascus vanleenenianus]|uniref:PHO85 cyclin family protein n=1 Tax=Trichomonascus vanleenenianus TaxID=2268995 RepID=UPI003ECB522B